MNLIGIVILKKYCIGVYVLDGVRVIGTLYKANSYVIFQYKEEEFMNTISSNYASMIVQCNHFSV